MEEELFCLLLVMLGYALGAIPFGIVVSKALNLPDPRTVGSKNVGFTNVLRVSGAKAGVLTLLGDMGKGWLIGWAAMQWLHHGVVHHACGAVADHRPYLFAVPGL